MLALKGVAWDPSRLANLALGLPEEGPTWDRLAQWGGDAENYYWLRTTIYYLQEPERDAERAIKRLMRAGRPYRALDVASMCIRRTKREDVQIKSLPVSKELILEVLQEAPRHNPEEEWYQPAMNMVAHHVERLLDILEKEGIENSVLAGVEWAWMPALEHSERGLKALQHALSTQPGLFVQVLRLVYRAKNEQPREVSPQEQARATQAYRLLENWKRVPGIVEEEYVEEGSKDDITFKRGRVDQEGLFRWVSEARELAEECGRLSICDSRIGKVFAHAPMDLDGRWPCEAVRNLIEELENEELERGLEIGVYNKRGLPWRAKGGEQEQSLAAKFHNYTEQARSRWPRTGGVLSRIAEQYEREAQWQDERDLIEEFE